MGSTTANLKLFKPAGAENVNVLTHLNENLDKVDKAGGAVICTQASRPVASYIGQRIYETDTQRTYRWNGTEWYPLIPSVLSTMGKTANFHIGDRVWLDIDWDAYQSNPVAGGVVNDFSMANWTTNNFIVPYTGVWHIRCQVFIGGPIGWISSITITGSTQAGARQMNMAGANVWTNCIVFEEDCAFVKGDVIKGSVYVAYGGGADAYGRSLMDLTFMTMRLLIEL